MSNSKLRIIAEVCIFSAIGLILDFIQGLIPQLWPSGGAIGISMCAVFVISFRRGYWGMLVGAIIGCLDMIDGFYISPFVEQWYEVFIQLALDYFLAWAVVGLAGVFAKTIIKTSSFAGKSLLALIGVVIGGGAKFMCHFISGMLFWPSEDFTNQFIYSFTYNGAYMLPSIFLCMIIMFVLYWKAPFIMDPNFNMFADVEEDEE